VLAASRFTDHGGVVLPHGVIVRRWLTQDSQPRGAAWTDTDHTDEEIEHEEVAVPQRAPAFDVTRLVEHEYTAAHRSYGARLTLLFPRHHPRLTS
jgi:hypothetical protein